MNAREHVGENAALYALGALDDVERRTVERHVAACDACAQLLAGAENDVTIVSAAQSEWETPPALSGRLERTLARGPVLVPYAPRRSVWRTALAAAVAAALIVGVVPTAYYWQQDAAMRRSMAADGQALQRLANSPHRTIAFDGMGPGTEAHVMYGSDGSWYVVLIRGASRALQVVWMHDGRRTTLGTAEPHGDVALLYLARSHRMDRLALMDGEQVVAEAQLAY